MENPFWAYIHRDDRKTIRIKHLYTPVNGLNDLENAKEEVKAGNDLIWYLFPDTIWAVDQLEALRTVQYILLSKGWFTLNSEWHCPSKDEPPKSRFENLEIE